MEELKFSNLARVLEEYGKEVRNRYQDELIRSDKIASGRLLNSVEYETRFEGNDYQVFLRLEDYWKYVENDTVPHLPPVDKILSWIQIKPVLPRPYYRKWSWTTVDGVYHENGKTILPTPQELAWIIAKKIERDGTTGTKDLQHTLEDVNSEYEKRIMDAIDADLSNFLDVELQFLITT